MNLVKYDSMLSLMVIARSWSEGMTQCDHLGPISWALALSADLALSLDLQSCWSQLESLRLWECSGWDLSMSGSLGVDPSTNSTNCCSIFLYLPLFMMAPFLTKKEQYSLFLSCFWASGSQYFSNHVRKTLRNLQLCSAVQRRHSTSSPKSLRMPQFQLMQCTTTPSSSQISAFSFNERFPSVSMNIPKAVSMTESFARGLLYSRLATKSKEQFWQGMLPKAMKLPAGKYREFSANRGCQKALAFCAARSCLSFSALMESMEILQILQPSLESKDSMSLVVYIFLPFLEFWKQCWCLFLRWRQRAGQLRYCLEQKHSQRATSLLNLDWLRLLRLLSPTLSSLYQLSFSIRYILFQSHNHTHLQSNTPAHQTHPTYNPTHLLTIYS